MEKKCFDMSFNLLEFVRSNVSFIGDKKEKEKTYEKILRTWNTNDNKEILIVFDYDGNLYEKYGKGQLLADFVSNEGVIPDYLMPILSNPRYGIDPKVIASTLTDFLAQEVMNDPKTDRFWGYSATAMMRHLIEYTIVLLKRDYFLTLADENKDSCLFRMLGEYNKEMITIMEKIATSDKGTNGRYPEFYKTLDEKTKKVYDVLCEYAKEDSGTEELFTTTISGNNSSRGNTANCILKTAYAQGGSFFSLLSMLSAGTKKNKCIPVLDINKYVRENTGQILYITGGPDKTISSGIAGLALISFSSAAEMENRKIKFMIPDMEKWDVFMQVDNILNTSYENTSFFLSFSNAIKMARVLFTSDIFVAIDELVEKTDKIVWHKTENSIIKNIFSSRIDNTREAIYGMSELGNNLVALENEQGDIQYLCIKNEEDEDISCNRTKRKLDVLNNAYETWFFNTLDKEKDDDCLTNFYDDDKEKMLDRAILAIEREEEELKIGKNKNNKNTKKYNNN